MADDLIMPKVAWYKRKLVWVVLLVVLAGAGGGAAWWLKPAADSSQANGVEDSQALYVSMSRPFIFSVPAGMRERLVQVEVQLMVRGAAHEATAKRHLPLLESTLLAVFSRQGADNYLSAEGKLVVRQDAQSELNQVLAEELGERLIEQVLFTGIVMQ
ncbi:flagellar basal body-associated FliL family protein [Zobellella iuensis]|uniref:Flagellar protein FliL n=1 Tax=Zobellella iuensis TaxID=2803811 RepID=A0ABS1QUT5_9GAMM|nr:flagellar basal body-associated FliL family protein [Zobellella iuensis]MBL1378382.1 flagellar basal body-associated FliL family protein [Zobellella iuensis]